MNILEEVQIYVADRLNADSQLSGLCPFIFENKRDIDYEIKSALGKQGIIGLVMTPKATFAGAFEDKSLAWQVDELEVDIIENVTVNRGKKNGYVTGQDAAMRLFDVLCPLSGDNEGQFNAVSYEEGEDNSLLVNKCVLKCLVHSVPLPDTTTKVKYTEASGLPDWKGDITGALSSTSIPNINYAEEVDIGINVTSIGTSAFRYCTSLTSVTIPDSVTSIGEGAFYHCPQLTSVTIPDTVTSIGQSAFYDCFGLTSVTIPDSMTSIGYRVFGNCRGLTSVTIPDSVTSIGNEAFNGCDGLTSVTIGSGVNNIGVYAFTGDTALEEVFFRGKTNEEIQAMANYPWGISDTSIIHGDPGYTYATLSGEVLVGDFEGVLTQQMMNGLSPSYHTRIDTVDVGNKVTEISAYAFTGIVDMTRISIPSSVTSIGDGAFYLNLRSLSQVELNEGLSSIGNEVFWGCGSLRNLTIPSTVESIGTRAFWGAGLSSLVFKGKTLDEVQAMENYPWSISNTSIISVED